MNAGEDIGPTPNPPNPPEAEISMVNRRGPTMLWPSPSKGRSRSSPIPKSLRCNRPNRLQVRTRHRRHGRQLHRR